MTLDNLELKIRIMSETALAALCLLSITSTWFTVLNQQSFNRLMLVKTTFVLSSNTVHTDQFNAGVTVQMEG